MSNDNLSMSSTSRAGSAASRETHFGGSRPGTSTNQHPIAKKVLGNAVRKNGGVNSKNKGRVVGNVAENLKGIRKTESRALSKMKKPVKNDTNMSGKKSTINHHNNATSQRSIGGHITSKSGSFRSANTHLPEPDEHHFGSSVRDPDQISLHSTNIEHEAPATTTETANESVASSEGGRGTRVKEVAKKIGKKIGKVAADTGASAVKDAPQYATLAAISQAGGKAQDTTVVNNIGGGGTPYNVYS